MTEDRRLTPKTLTALEQGSEASLRLLRGRPEFIWHREAEHLNERLEIAYHDAMSGDCDGTEHLLIIGPTGNGKTSLVKRFARRHQRPDDPALSAACIPVLYTRMAPTGSPTGYLRSVMGELGAKYSASNSLDQLYPSALTLMRRIAVKVVIIDELHHVIFGKRDEKLKMLNLIKDLGEQLGCIIVGCGLKEALYAMRWDAQLDRRFEPLPLRRWELNADYCDLLYAIEQTLPLREASDLAGEELAPWIASQSEGTMRETQRLLRRAAMVAIQRNRGRIDMDLLQEINWVKPSLRRHQAERALGGEHMPMVA